MEKGELLRVSIDKTDLLFGRIMNEVDRASWAFFDYWLTQVQYISSEPRVNVKDCLVVLEEYSILDFMDLRSPERACSPLEYSDGLLAALVTKISHDSFYDSTIAKA